MKCSLPIRTIKANPNYTPGEELPFTVLGPNSPLSYLQAASLLAADFANYAHFSPAPYGANEARIYGNRYLRDRVLLFTKPIGERKFRCFGAVGMRWEKHEFTDMPEGEGWFMTWAWFHPGEQRKGHLTNAWRHILRLFPGFMPAPPATHAMGSFLKKVKFDHPRLRGRPFPTIAASE